jgi:hypothetical protein
MRVGRTLAYWSNPWQIGSRRPHRLTWSGTSGAPTAPKKIASKRRSRSSPSAGIISPCAFHQSEPQSKVSTSKRRSPSLCSSARSTCRPASTTSGPMPSAGIAAME